MLEVVESQACRAQLAAAGPLPSEAEIEKAKDEVEQLGQSRPRRRLRRRRRHRAADRGTAEDRTAESGGDSGPKSVEIDLDLKLTGVNEEQTISAPANAKPLSKLFLKLDVNPIELLGLLQGEGGGEGLGELLEGLGASQLR